MKEDHWTAIYGVFNHGVCLYIGATQNWSQREKSHRSRFGKKVEFRIFQWTRSCNKAGTLERRFIKRYQKLGEAKFNGKPQHKSDRISSTLNYESHRRLKALAKKRGNLLNHLIDEAVWQFLKREGTFGKWAI